VDAGKGASLRESTRSLKRAIVLLKLVHSAQLDKSLRWQENRFTFRKVVSRISCSDTHELGRSIVTSVRIWSFHPKYLDARGLVALWREGLLAQAVLRGETKGYAHHPQLLRFRGAASPVGCIAAYLRAVHKEATARGYCFEAKKISRVQSSGQLSVPHGQLEFEWHHLLKKLALRDPQRHAKLACLGHPTPHPLFRLIRGGVASWEKGVTPPNKVSKQPRRRQRTAKRKQ